MSATDAAHEGEDSLNSDSYEDIDAPSSRFPRWIKVGAIAAVSVLAGGLAATWYYRKTLSRMRQAEENSENSDFGMNNERKEDEN